MAGEEYVEELEDHHRAQDELGDAETEGKDQHHQAAAPDALVLVRLVTSVIHRSVPCALAISLNPARVTDRM